MTCKIWIKYTKTIILTHMSAYFAQTHTELQQCQVWSPNLQCNFGSIWRFGPDLTYRHEKFIYSFRRLRGVRKTIYVHTSYSITARSASKLARGNASWFSLENRLSGRTLRFGQEEPYRHEKFIFSFCTSSGPGKTICVHTLLLITSSYTWKRKRRTLPL